jgi:hypothetical protein
MLRRDLSKALIISGLAGLSSASKGYASTLPIANNSFSRALGKDIPIMAEALTSLHPGLYRYLTKAQFQQNLKKLTEFLSEERDLLACYGQLSLFLSSIRCGHTYANFFNQTVLIKKTLVDPANKLPFYFQWIGSKMVVTQNPLSLAGLEVGSVIKKIDQKPVSEILSKLMAYVRADGSNNDKRRALLEVSGGQGIETFDIFFPIAFPNSSPSFLVESEKQLIAAPKWDQSQRLAYAPKKTDKFSDDYWRLTRRDDAAILSMDGWGLYDVKWDWRKKIQLFFEQLDQWGVKNLIIDIRNNEGGLDCGNEIMRFLIPSPLKLNKTYERRVIFRQTPESLNPYLDTWDNRFRTLGKDSVDLGTGFYRLPPPDIKDEDGILIEPLGPRFQGQVAILSSPTNSSATFQFMSQMRRLKLAKIYGQVTGGNQKGINGGAFFFLRLPHSGLEIDLPLIGSYPSEDMPDSGLKPDIHIEPKIEDIGEGYDRVLEECLLDFLSN